MMQFWHSCWNGSNGLWGPSNMMGWIGGGIALFIGLILIAVLIYALLSRNREGIIHSVPPGNGYQPAGDALRILNERYARGEIKDDEYRRMKNELLH